MKPEPPPSTKTPLPNEVLRLLPPMEPYRPFSRRRRLLIGGGGIVAATVILGSMLLTDAEYLAAKLAQALSDVPRCEAGQTEGCVGGRTDVIVLPAAPAASR